MKPGNGNPAALQHTLKILMQGIERPFFYDVPEAEKNRIEAFLESLPEDASQSRFIVFGALDQQLQVAVSLHYLQLIHFLWDPAVHVTEEPQLKRDGNVRVYLHRRAEPLEVTVDDPAEAVQLVTGLDSQPGFFGTFHTFEDVDAEPLSVRVGQIMLLEISSDIVQEGFEELKKGESGEKDVNDEEDL